MDIDKAAVVEKRVDRIRGFAAYAENRRKQIGAGTQIRLFTQVFHAVALFLQRIIRCGRALDGDSGRLNLERLLILRREQNRPGNGKGGTDVLRSDFIVVFDVFTGKDNLNAAEKAAVIQIDKAKRFTVADAACPAAECDGFTVIRRQIQIDVFYQFTVHNVTSCEIVIQIIRGDSPQNASPNGRTFCKFPPAVRRKMQVPTDAHFANLHRRYAGYFARAAKISRFSA